MQRHHKKVATPGQPFGPASTASRFARRSLRALRGRVGRLSTATYQLARTVLLMAKKLMRFLLQAVRHPAKGLFPPVGILSILALTLLTVGIPFGRAIVHLWPLAIFTVCGIVLVLILYRTPRERYNAIFTNTFGWLPVFLGALSYGYWYWYASQRGDPGPDFFHAAAEVLPLLLLAAVVDVRRAEHLQSKQLVLPIVAVFLGEIAALNALAFGGAGPYDFAAVASSFVSSIVALVLAVMADIAPSSGHEAETMQTSSDPALGATNSEEPEPKKP
jgi:hypothetical protein